MTGVPAGMLIQMAIVLALMLGALVLGVYMIRRARNEMLGAEPGRRVAADENSGFEFAAYTGVIQKMREQERELEQLRRAERDRASESASLSEAVLSNLGSGVVVFSPTLLVRQANPAARELVAFSSPVGLHARDLFRGVEAVRLGAEMQQSDAVLAERGEITLPRAVELAARQGESFRRLEADYRGPDGVARVLGITISPFRAANGDSLGAVCLISDLTEVARLTQQVQLQEKMAALGEMSAGIAHEFKNSLATISGYAQMLRQDAQGESARNFAERIAGETTSLARIVSDFLAFARPQELSREPVDLAAVLMDCAGEAGVQIECKAANTALVVRGDPTALRQAISNLLRNSAEACGRDARPVVKVEAAEEDGMIRLRLQDNGCGIPEANAQRIFLPFFTTKAEGTGLGLALVHRIVTEHGGSIRLERSESGAAFTLALPAEKGAKTQEISG